MRYFIVYIVSFSLLFFQACKPKDPVDLRVPLETISFLESVIDINVGDTLMLPLVKQPENATDTIQWSSSNEKVLVFDAEGNATALARGYSVIEASSGTLSAKCQVNVLQEVTDFKLVWSDEFDGNLLDDTKWNIETGGNGWGNQEKQYYTNRTENLRIENGVLVIEARKESYNGSEYTSARINTKKKVNFGYGRIETRMKLPSGAGTWPAYWMMGSNYDVAKWPLCGEIDIMEHIGSQPTMLSNALHTSEKNGMKGNNWYKRSDFTGLETEFHVYALEKEEKYMNGDDCLKFYFDDVLLATVYEPHVDATLKNWPFKQDFFVILNLALGGTMGGQIDNSIFASTVNLQVDYVRFYQRE